MQIAQMALHQTTSWQLPTRWKASAAPPIYTSLGLSLGLVAVVLAGARIIGGGAPTVTLSDLPAEHADSAECQQLIDSLPDEVADLPRAEIAEPAPAGVARLGRRKLWCWRKLPRPSKPAVWRGHSVPIQRIFTHAGG